MTSTTTAVTSVPAPAAGAGVRSLGVRETLQAAAAARRSADLAEAELLALAVHLVDLFPVDVDEVTGEIDPERAVASWQPAGFRVHHSLAAETADVAGGVAGPGAPLVAERAVEELGAALGVSYRSALGLVADAVELCFRLPRIWALVQAGRLQAWKARAVAALTRGICREAAGFVDRQLLVAGAAANRVPSTGMLRGLVHEALAQHDPETAVGREEAALAHREVVFDHRRAASTATTQLSATLDTLDALDLDATVSAVAGQLRDLGDESDLGVRRAHALALLAHPQRVLDLAGHTTDRSTDRSATPPAVSPAAAVPTGSQTEAAGSSAVLYLHVSAEDLREVEGVAGVVRCGRVERLGAATLDLLAGWLRRSEQLTIRPVLDRARSDGVDAHDPPGWMRELVMLRDGHCVFPGCRVDARVCDLDHIEAYRPPDEGGPPGQTRPDNLAPLCRRHHRLKTHTGWTYQRAHDPDGQDHATGPPTYLWRSPYGFEFHTHGTPAR